jgi:hypothetical protein
MSPRSSLCAFDNGCHTFLGLPPCTYKGVIAKEAYNSRSTSSAIVQEDLLVPYEYLIAPFYVDFGSKPGTLGAYREVLP